MLRVEFERHSNLNLFDDVFCNIDVLKCVYRSIINTVCHDVVIFIQYPAVNFL